MAAGGTFYKHAGHYDRRRLALLFGICVPAATVLGGLYGELVGGRLSLLLSVLTALPVGLWIALIVQGTARWAHVASTRIVVACAFVSLLCCLYATWVCRLYAVSGYQVLLLSPLTIVHTLEEIASQRAWMLAQNPPATAALYFIWITEAVVMAVVSIIGTLHMFRKVEPYCGRCRKWLTGRINGFPLTQIVQHKPLVAQLKAGNAEVLLSLSTLPARSTRYTEVMIRFCKTCEELHVLTVSNVLISEQGISGKVLQRNAIVKDMLLTPEMSEIIRRHICTPPGREAVKFL